MTTTEMRVHIDCLGCQRMIRKALQNMKGVDDVDIDMVMQKVTVTGWADQKKIIKRLRKTGKIVELWQFPHNPVTNNQNFPNDIQYNQHQHHAGPATYYAEPPPSSSYNYYKHGYNNHAQSNYADYSSHHRQNSSIFGRAGDAFSDESVHGCSIM